jgi:hypothetical protein
VGHPSFVREPEGTLVSSVLTATLLVPGKFQELFKWTGGPDGQEFSGQS